MGGATVLVGWSGYVELERGPHGGGGPLTPHIKEVPIRRKMVSVTFFAERGLL